MTELVRCVAQEVRRVRDLVVQEAIASGRGDVETGELLDVPLVIKARQVPGATDRPPAPATMRVGLSGVWVSIAVGSSSREWYSLGVQSSTAYFARAEYASAEALAKDVGRFLKDPVDGIRAVLDLDGSHAAADISRTREAAAMCPAVLGSILRYALDGGKARPWGYPTNYTDSGFARARLRALRLQTGIDLVDGPGTQGYQTVFSPAGQVLEVGWPMVDVVRGLIDAVRAACPDVSPACDCALPQAPSSPYFRRAPHPATPGKTYGEMVIEAIDLLADGDADLVELQASVGRFLAAMGDVRRNVGGLTARWSLSMWRGQPCILAETDPECVQVVVLAWNPNTRGWWCPTRLGGGGDTATALLETLKKHL